MPLTVVRGIILPEFRYRRFQVGLLAEAPFIAVRTQLTGYNEKFDRSRCLLVTARRRQGGILVDSEGYTYARYVAYVQDKRELELADVPRDNLDFKTHERRVFFFSAGEGIETHLPFENGHALCGEATAVFGGDGTSIAQRYLLCACGGDPPGPNVACRREIAGCELWKE